MSRISFTPWPTRAPLTSSRWRAAYAALGIAVDSAAGRNQKAFDATLALLNDPSNVLTDEPMKKAFLDGTEAGLRAGRLEEVERVLDVIDARQTPQRPPFVTAHAARFRGRLAAERGDAQAAEAAFLRAMRIFEEINAPLWLAVTRVELAELLSETGRRREAQPLLDQARSTFAALETTSWIDRSDKVTVLSSAS